MIEAAAPETIESRLHARPESAMLKAPVAVCEKALGLKTEGSAEVVPFVQVYGPRMRGTTNTWFVVLLARLCGYSHLMRRSC